jgi:hypothetical protein
MLTIELGGGWGQARPADRRDDAIGWKATTVRDLITQVSFQKARPADGAMLVAAWDKVSMQDSPALVMAWDSASVVSAADQSLSWSDVPFKDMGLQSGWGHTLRACDVQLRLIYNPMPAKKDVHTGFGFRRVNEFGPRHDAAAAVQESLYIPGTSPLAFRFGGSAYAPSTAPLVFFDFRYVPAKPVIQPTDSEGIGVRWADARRLDRVSRLPWGKARVLDGELTGIEYIDYPGPVKPLPEPPPNPEILDTYMIANTVTLVVLPSRTPVEASSIRIGLDADSFSWKFSADIFTCAAMDYLRPDEDGAKEVELDINGWKWVLVIERYTRQLKFPTEAYSISGVSRTQLLAGPYAPLRTGLNNAPITARQAADEQLLYTGFTLNWDAENVGPADWTFPAGLFSYQSQTAMQVIARIAETVGAIVCPARDTDSLTVQPRYPVPPWEWEQVDAPIDRIIPPAMMTQLDGDWTPQPAWNACYVSGTSAGVSMLVRRAGTAGDNPTADVFDDWITSEEANRARGIHELSKGGNIEIVGFTLPLFHQPDDKGVGLILPGMLCRVPESQGAWVGLCLSVDITASGVGASRVDQQIKLERHH